MDSILSKAPNTLEAAYSEVMCSVMEDMQFHTKLAIGVCQIISELSGESTWYPWCWLANLAQPLFVYVRLLDIREVPEIAIELCNRAKIGVNAIYSCSRDVYMSLYSISLDVSYCAPQVYVLVLATSRMQSFAPFRSHVVIAWAAELVQQCTRQHGIEH
eukprot:2426051-Amphidinium_carterae.1